MRHMNSRPLIVNVDELAMKLGDFRGRRLEAQQCGDGLLVTDLDEPDLYVRVHSSGVVQPYLKPEEHDCGAGCERAHEACALPRFVLRGCVAYQCNMIARWFILRVGRLRLEWKGGAGALSNAAYPATNEDRWQAVRSWQALLEQAMTDDQTAQPRHFDCRNKHVCRVALALTGEHGYEFLASILGDLVGCTTLSQAFCESADSAGCRAPLRFTGYAGSPCTSGVSSAVQHCGAHARGTVASGRGGENHVVCHDAGRAVVVWQLYQGTCAHE